MYLTYGSISSILFSIALSQFLLGAALLATFASGITRRFPPIKLPLALLFGWTLLSALHSGYFWQGFPQIRKFFVFATALIVASCLSRTKDVGVLVWIWGSISFASSLAAFIQLWQRYRQARAERASYYEYFLDARLHGFAGHWMTFGGELMIVSVLLLAVVLFSGNRTHTIFASMCLPILCATLVLGLTRGVFLIGLPTGAAYLFFTWKPWSVLAIPAAFLAAAFTMPFQVRERIISVIRPHGNDDSNLRRMILTRSGLRMISSHPIVGLGPERVGRDFMAYVPEDIPRPLPKGWYGHLHNIYLQYAAERGIPALVFVLWIIAKPLYDFHRKVRTKPGAPDAWVLRGAVAVILAIMAEGLFEHNLGDSEVLTMFLTVVSCGYVVAWSGTDQHESSQGTTTSREPMSLAQASC